MGMIFASRWPMGQSAAAPSLSAAATAPQSADMETTATASAAQDGVADAAAIDGQEGEDAIGIAALSMSMKQM